MPSGLKNKMVILHATTTTMVKIDHTKRPLLTHTLPPQPPEEYDYFLGGGEGVIYPPLPCLMCKEVQFEEPLLFVSCEMYQSTKKEKHKHD